MPSILRRHSSALMLCAVLPSPICMQKHVQGVRDERREGAEDVGNGSTISSTFQLMCAVSVRPFTDRRKGKKRKVLGGKGCGGRQKDAGILSSLHKQS